jgi:hypothetical protein
VGDSILVIGAGASSSTLQTVITNITGNVITVNSSASVSVAAAAVTKTGKLVDTTIDSTFKLPGQKLGQVVSASSITAWVNNASVQTLTSGFDITPNTNLITLTTTTGLTGTTTATSNTVTMASTTGLQVGDSVSIVGAGTASAVLTSTISAIVANTSITLTNAAVLTVVGTAVTKIVPVNVNSTTNTLRAEPGDKVKLTYLTLGSVATVFTSTIQTVVTSSGLNGSIVNFSLADSLPNSTVIAAQKVLVTVQKTYNDIQIPATNPLTSGSNLDVTGSSSGNVIIKASVSLIYGKIITGDVFFGYSALRTDLSNRILTINDAADLIGQLEDITDKNPLGLAVQVALANTTGRIRAIAISSDDLAGYQAALAISEGERLYWLAPLTQDQSIIAVFKAHCIQMSTPANASWRLTLANTSMPLVQDVGPYSATLGNSNGGNNVTTASGLNFMLTASNATFITDGVTAGDSIVFHSATDGTQVGAHTVVSVISNQQLIVDTPSATTAINYHISRNMSKTQTATSVASVSSTNNTSRVIHVQPDLVGVTIEGVTKYLPGYYLCAGLAGMGAGFPVQQGFTNVGIAGIVDLKHSNFFFSKQELNSMAGAGTCLFVQDTQGGNPYCRHELTTDMSTLNYREILMVKELDFLSYFYVDKLKSFIGSWNITKSSLNTLRQTIVAGSELLKSQILPKIGAVLVAYNIVTLEQDPVNKDHVTCVVTVSVGTPMNYVDLTLVV